MTTILANYTLNKRTIALLPAKQIEYETIAVEEDRRFFIKKSALQIIQEACIKNGSTYEGRRDAVIQLTGFKRKVPIPISIKKNIYTFPTHSPKDYDCIWLFHNHIQAAFPLSTPIHSNVKSMILLSNQQHLPLFLSNHTLQKQIERTRYCIYLFAS